MFKIASTTQCPIITSLIEILPVAIILFGAMTSASAETPWHAGFSRVDVTPTEPVRMAGYGNRDHPSEGIDTPLYVRGMALKHTSSDEPPLVLLTVDTIGIPGSMARSLTEAIKQKHGLSREQIVLCSTHTHCGPDLVSELSNIFSTPLTEDEIAAGKRYKSQLLAGILKATDLAIADMAPAALDYEVGKATFAVNRRVLTSGKWTGFGIQPDGPVDHTVPVLRITDDHQQVRGVVFNYACHGTTLGGRHYNINAEWCGYACNHLESKYSGAIALCTIGCGADANPNPRDSIDAAKVHGRTLAGEIMRTLGSPMLSVDAPVTAAFDHAALSFDLPTEEELQQRVENSKLATQRPQEIRHAKRLLDIYQRERRLPATYPVPIQTWQFGDQLSMIFMGGEVVVDYAIRLKKQLNDPKLWVTAYANDVLGYIASERVRQEGGYEVDRSGIYYGLPGRWATGTEDLLIQSIEELLKSQKISKPLPADEARRSLRVPEGMRVELVAAEPLVRDPINVAFGADGKLWVVEMGDYPEGENGGRIKWLADSDGDGKYDSATEFLAELSFPTGVLPWRDGVLISAAPDILFAKDTDDDGQADQVEKLYTGFDLANPQHRINGFTYGLDHSLHLASGDNLHEIKSVRTSQNVNASGHDVQIWPSEGRIAVTSGRTQFVRARNDWGEWFGNDNSRPMYHFPIDDAYLRRNPAATYSGNTQQLFSPPVAPRVFPVTAATQRFNDLFAANRFTSACSAIIARTPHFNVDSNDVAFICEPVHNLVHRSVLVPEGASYQATRAETELQNEFLASSDPWFRPVRAAIGPDGMLWVVDMYRQTIEHPKWIPESWQKQLDLRAGSDQGRIYRVAVEDFVPSSPVKLDQHSTEELVNVLRSPVGTIRDLAQQLIIERDDPAATDPLVELALATDTPQARVHALSILGVQSRLSNDTLNSALHDSHPGVLLVAIRLAESRINQSLQRLTSLENTSKHSDMRVVMQTAIALGESDCPRAGKILGEIASRPNLDTWTARAIISSATPHAEVILREMFTHFKGEGIGPSDVSKSLLEDLLVTAHSTGVNIVESFAPQITETSSDLGQQIELASSFCRALKTRNQKSPSIKRFAPLYRKAVQVVRDPIRPATLRCTAMDLLGTGIEATEVEQELLVDLIQPATPASVQQRAIDCLTRIAPEDSCRTVIDRWPSMTMSVREHFISRMLERQTATAVLLDAMEDGAINVNELTPAARQQLTRTGSRSMRVRAERLVRTTGSVTKTALVRTYLSEMNGNGDQEQGAALFKQHCAVCHVPSSNVPSSNGQSVGASLDNLTDRGDEALLTAILDPNRAVDPKYQTYAIETDDGRVLAGAIEHEVGASITLAHADGKRSVIGRDEVTDIKNTGVSLMPEGMETVLSHQAMRHLLAHLQQQRSP